MIEVDLSDLQRAIDQVAKDTSPQRVVSVMSSQLKRTLTSMRRLFIQYNQKSTGLSAKDLRRRIKISVNRHTGVGYITINEGVGRIAASRYTIRALPGGGVELRGRGGKGRAFRQTIREGIWRVGKFSDPLILTSHGGQTKPALSRARVGDRLIRTAPRVLDIVMKDHLARVVGALEAAAKR